MKYTGRQGAGMDSNRAVDQRVDDDLARFMADMEERAGLSDPAQEFCRPRNGRTGGGAPQPAGIARLAPDTKARVRRFRLGRRARIVNAALGSAIFASMSIGSLAILGAPYGYIFAAGTAALAVLLPMRELRGNV